MSYSLPIRMAASCLVALSALLAPVHVDGSDPDWWTRAEFEIHSSDPALREGIVLPRSAPVGFVDRTTGDPRRFRLLLSGSYTRKGWSLGLGGETVVDAVRTGDDFELELWIYNEITPLALEVIGPEGQVHRGELWIRFSGVRRATQSAVREEARSARLSLGVFGYSTHYVEDIYGYQSKNLGLGIDFESPLGRDRASLWVKFQGGVLSASKVFTNASQSSSVTHLLARIALGLSPPAPNQKLSIEPYFGLVFNTLSVNPPIFGLQNLVGFELYPLIRWRRANGSETQFFPRLGLLGGSSITTSARIVSMGISHRWGMDRSHPFGLEVGGESIRYQASGQPIRWDTLRVGLTIGLFWF